jgi:hypothetical protein
MLVHQIILTKKPNQNTTMKNIIKTIKKQVILFTFCINILLCFASCAYFSAAETKMQEVREIQRDAKEVLETPNLTGEWDIETLEDAVAQDIKDMERKIKKDRVRAVVSNRR